MSGVARSGDYVCKRIDSDAGACHHGYLCETDIAGHESANAYSVQFGSLETNSPSAMSYRGVM